MASAVSCWVFHGRKQVREAKAALHEARTEREHQRDMVNDAERVRSSLSRHILSMQVKNAIQIIFRVLTLHMHTWWGLQRNMPKPKLRRCNNYFRRRPM